MIEFIAFHHVQLAMPKGGEAMARRFFVDVLGMTEISKPEVLQGRGGVWFEAGGVQLHLGVDPDFTPARKAHPAIQVANLSNIISQLDGLSVPYKRDVDLPAFSRIFVDDPFGNRIEIVEVT